MSLISLSLGMPITHSVALATAVNPAAIQEQKQSLICQKDLASTIEQIINQPQFKRSRWGIEIQTTTGEILYRKNGNQFFTPASSAKLLSTAAILATLGANHSITTPVLATGNAPNLDSLRLIGKGDPSISTQNLNQIAQELKALGIKQIKQLIIDDSYFNPPTINPTWEWLDVHSYFATAVTSMILNQNTVTLTLFPQQLGELVKYSWSDFIAGRQWQIINQGITGAKDIPYNIEIDGDLGKPQLQIRGELGINEPPDVWDLAVVDPANYFLESLRLHLTQAGITVNRGTVLHKPEQNESEWPVLALNSPALASIIQEINQESNNLYAEALAEILAKKLNTDSPIAAIEQSLAKLGLNPEEYVLVDASGLSRQNLVSPATLVKTLNLISTLPRLDNQAYQNSLAIAGINGTLKNRFKNTSVAGKFWGKTGTLTGVSSLSGYLFTTNNSALIISIIVNNSELSNQEIRTAIDRIVIALNHFPEC